MSTTTPVAERHLSLDILAASEINDNKIKVWTTHNSEEQNGTSHTTDLRNAASNPDSHRSSLNVQSKIKANGLPKEQSDSKENQLQSQSSEVKLTWLQKLLTWRFVMLLLLQSSFIVVLFLMSCLPMAMVCMVRPPGLLSSNFSLTNGSSLTSNTTNGEGGVDAEVLYRSTTSAMDTNYEFDWDAEVQGLVLASIMFSSFLGPILMSVVKEHLSGKLTMSICNLISAALMFLSPVAARISPYCLVVLRIILGILLGANVPVVGDCVAWWAPQDERLTMISLTFTGVNVGGILSSFISGYLCLVPLDNGWPFVFYTFGTISLIWGICWHFLSSNKPEEHPYISEKEKQYIITHRAGMNPSAGGGTKVKPPYRKIVTSYPVLAYFISGICHIWSTQVFITYLPLYFNKVMQFSVQETGLIASLISAFRLFGSLLWTTVGNKMVSIVGIKRSRKLCIVIGFSLCGVTTIMVGFFDETYKWLVLGLLLFVMTNQAVGASILTAVPLDMAPRYAGLLTGMYVSFGSFVSVSGPLLTAYTTSNGTQEEWRTVWIIMGSLFITGAVVFLIFGQSSIQPWAQGKSADVPHIVSPFVSMGHRFSSFIVAPPLSPVTPKENGFDFLQIVKAPPTSILSCGLYDISTGGTINEAFHNSEDKHVDNSDIQISRL